MNGCGLAENELWFHIVLRAGVGLMTFLRAMSNNPWPLRVSHTKQRMPITNAIFTGIYGRPLECGERSRQTFST